jgi:hypothetical protein
MNIIPEDTAHVNGVLTPSLRQIPHTQGAPMVSEWMNLP